VRRRSSAGPPQRWGRCWILASALPWVACAPAGPPSEEASPATAVVPATEEYTKQIEGWREERRANLLSEDGWFSLVGLYWLEPGASTFGSGEDADLGFPAGTPERIGTFHLEDGEVTLEPAAGSGLRIADGEPVAGTIPLAADTSGDPTNGHGTYGGGRFLYADPPGEDGRVVLDFNRAYNPPCAFTPFATCPLPPDVNKLDVAVRAGEKSYAGEVAGHQAG
jgi:uncharacterized protein (DUF1684 family)